MDKGDMQTLLNKGNIHSFECLVVSYEKRVCGFIYNLVHNPSLAEDLTQDVFVKIYQNIYKYNPEYPIEPWMFKITYNLTLNYLRKNRIKEVQIEEGMIGEDTLENQIIESEERKIILKEISSFKPDCRAILYLRIIENLTFAEMSSMFDTSPASIKLKFYRSRKMLIKNLSDYFNEVKL